MTGNYPNYLDYKDNSLKVIYSGGVLHFMTRFYDADRFIRGIGKVLDDSSNDQREELIGMLQRLIEEKIVGSMDSDAACRCRFSGSEKLNRYGRTKAGTQRFQCKSCKKVFADIQTGNLLLNTKLEASQWEAFVICFVDRLPLRATAARCDVSLRSAWYMRFRMMQLIHENLPSFEFKEGIRVEVDEFYTTESFKGNQKKAGFQLPRGAYKHGSKGHSVGTSDDNLCILTGINDLGDMFYSVACRGYFSKQVARHELKKRIGEGSIIVTDNHSSYTKLLRQLGIEKNVKHESHPAEEHGPLNRINGLHSEIREFFHSFNGVSSKYLDLYLGWFKWLKSYGGMHMPAAMDNLKPQMAVGSYQTVRSRLPEIKFPFHDQHGNPTKY